MEEAGFRVCSFHKREEDTPLASDVARADKIDHPAHYQSKSGLEVIAVLEAFELSYATGNAVKYLLRAGKKAGEPEADDLRKALWYIERRLAQLKATESGETGDK